MLNRSRGEKGSYEGASQRALVEAGMGVSFSSQHTVCSVQRNSLLALHLREPQVPRTLPAPGGRLRQAPIG